MYIGKKIQAKGTLLGVPTVFEIREQLTTNDNWVRRGLKAIYKMQTEDEKLMQVTTEDNGVGFSGVDAELLSSFAEQLNARGSLSPKQMVYARKKMAKYAKQLWTLAYEKAEARVANAPAIEPFLGSTISHGRTGGANHLKNLKTFAKQYRTSENSQILDKVIGAVGATV